MVLHVIAMLGTVLHTKPQGFNTTRAPLQLGAELFGSDSIDADVEMVDLMISLLQEAGWPMVSIWI